MKTRKACDRSIVLLTAALAFALTLTPAIANADVVTTWVAVAEAVAPRFGGPQPQSRVQAMIQIAVHDALNSIEGRYKRYASTEPLSPDASPDAAVAAASRHVMLELLAAVPDSPQKQAALGMIQAAYDATVGPGPYDASTMAGLAVGEAAADAILALRAGDGSETPNLPYSEPLLPGVYQPTPNPEFPAVITPAFANWANVTPFSLNHTAQFEVEPGAIFDLTSDAYASEYNEVKTLGDARVRGSVANADSEESDIARFWPGGGSNWNNSARSIVGGMNLDRWQHARLFALINIATADALIANMTWKYFYKFWRPVTAIRWADDGNPDTQADPTWRPFLVTPPYPDYPCALPAATGAATSVLREFFETDHLEFTVTFNAPAVPLPAPLAPLAPKAITRHFVSLSQAAAESQSARVFGGLHFREGCVAGALQGTKVGRFVVRTELQELHAKSN
jgi:hypothetical protein